MTPSRKPLALFLTILLALSTVALSSSTNAEETNARSTGTEEISITLGSSATYYDRTDSSTTTQFTATVTSSKLDVNSEYNIVWNLCQVYAQSDGASNSHYYRCSSAVNPSNSELNGEIDIGSGSAVQTTTFTFTDPGITGLDNGLYGLKATLRISTVDLATDSSEVFNLGGELETQGDYVSQVTVNQDFLLTDDISFFGNIVLDHAPLGFLKYTIDCSLFEDGVAAAVDATTFLDRTSYWDMSERSFVIGSNSNTLTATNGGTHHVECVVIRNVDGTNMGTIVGNDFEVVDDTSNQDDATISVAVNMHSTEAWGTVTIDAIDLDAGQEYTLNWVVEDNSLSTPTVMMQNDHIWVAGNDGTYTYELEFHDLADTTNACITVTFTAGNDELQVVDNVCWASASTSDFDGDEVYDKDDLCPNSPAGVVVQADGCSDSDGDGFDSGYEVDCGSDPNDQQSIPSDVDNDGTCDALDADADDDGYLNEDEVAAGTDPFDSSSKPENRLPTCAVYYSLEADGIPTTFDGDAAIPALSGVSAQTAVSALIPTTIAVPEGNYYITAHCVDLDGDDITVTVNDITVGPMAGEVSAGAVIEIGEDVDETMDVQITWSDGTDSLTALVTVELDGDNQSLIPGFGTALTIMALLCAGFILARKDD